MAKLGHPDGEINLTKGAASTGIIQVVRQVTKPLNQLTTRSPLTHPALWTK